MSEPTVAKNSRVAPYRKNVEALRPFGRRASMVLDGPRTSYFTRKNVEYDFVVVFRYQSCAVTTA